MENIEGPGDPGVTNLDANILVMAMHVTEWLLRCQEKGAAYVY